MQRQLLIAAVSAFALALPAAAQNSSPSNPRQIAPQQQMQRSDPGTPARGGAQGAMQDRTGTMQPSQLSEDQVRQIQQRLKAAGQQVRVDGVWGPETENALRGFQQQRNLQGQGQLDQSTLGALGVTISPSGPYGGSPAGQPGSGATMPGTGTGLPGAGLTGSGAPGSGLPGSSGGQQNNAPGQPGSSGPAGSGRGGTGTGGSGTGSGGSGSGR